MGQNYEKCSCLKMQNEDTITSNYQPNNNSFETNIIHENNKQKKLKLFNGIIDKLLNKNSKELFIQSIFRG